uniref:Serine/threonine-protein kinase nek3 n=2 Tax=Hirondellea gigas TaxID=1518452 RepID=A0A6A7FXX7_9CRUS
MPDSHGPCLRQTTSNSTTTNNNTSNSGSQSRQAILSSSILSRVSAPSHIHSNSSSNIPPPPFSETCLTTPISPSPATLNIPTTHGRNSSSSNSSSIINNNNETNRNNSNSNNKCNIGSAATSGVSSEAGSHRTLLPESTTSISPPPPSSGSSTLPLSNSLRTQQQQQQSSQPSVAIVNSSASLCTVNTNSSTSSNNSSTLLSSTLSSTTTTSGGTNSGVGGTARGGGAVLAASVVSADGSGSVSKDGGYRSQEQKPQVTTVPTVVRFPAVPAKKDLLEVCLWKDCNKAIDQSTSLLEHIQAIHVEGQLSCESFRCLWVGCKVYERSSCSVSWLERHVLTHGGHKPFKCIVDGCGHRFTSQTAMGRHVNHHFNQPASSSGSSSNNSSSLNNNNSCSGSSSAAAVNSSSNNSSTGGGGQSSVAQRPLHQQGASPSKLWKKHGRKLRLRRRPWSARMFDFFDVSIMEKLQWGLVCVNNTTTTNHYKCNTQANIKQELNHIDSKSKDRSDGRPSDDVIVMESKIVVSPNNSAEGPCVLKTRTRSAAAAAAAAAVVVVVDTDSKPAVNSSSIAGTCTIESSKESINSSPVNRRSSTNGSSTGNQSPSDVPIRGSNTSSKSDDNNTPPSTAAAATMVTRRQQQACGEQDSSTPPTLQNKTPANEKQWCTQSVVSSSVCQPQKQCHNSSSSAPTANTQQQCPSDGYGETYQHDCITMYPRVVGRRTTIEGVIEELVQWSPPNVIQDGWVPQGCSKSITLPLSALSSSGQSTISQMCYPSRRTRNRRKRRPHAPSEYNNVAVATTTAAAFNTSSPADCSATTSYNFNGASTRYINSTASGTSSTTAFLQQYNGGDNAYTNNKSIPKQCKSETVKHDEDKSTSKKRLDVNTEKPFLVPYAVK